MFVAVIPESRVIGFVVVLTRAGSSLNSNKCSLQYSTHPGVREGCDGGLIFILNCVKTMLSGF
jgi:hypothetical protein